MSAKGSFGLAASNNWLLSGTKTNDFIFFTGNSNQSVIFGCSNTSNIQLAINSSGKLAVGKSNPSYTLDVAGDINFDGILLTNGVPYISSQWSNTSNTVFITDSNIAIGTQTATTGFTSAYDSTFHSNVTIFGALTVSNIQYVTSNIVILNSQIVNSNITTLNTLTFSNQTGNVLLDSLNSNLGIDTPTPQYKLDVVGDVNASGVVRQNGVPIVQSQWSNNNSNLFITQSNIGIGLSNPQADLHVRSNAKIDGSLVVNGIQCSAIEFIGSAQVASYSQIANQSANANQSFFKNKIINGDLSINQRNITFSNNIGSSTFYSFDRWMLSNDIVTGAISMSNVNLIPIDAPYQYGFSKSLRYTVTTPCSNYKMIAPMQRIEGTMMQDVTWGGFEYEFPEFPMTTISSNFSTAIVPGNYVLSSSPEGNSGSSHSHYTYMAFNKASGDYAVSYYAVVYYYSNGNNIYTGPTFTTASGSNFYGEWLQLEVPQSLTLVKYTMKAPGISFARGPNIFSLLGSTNNSTWDLIETRNGITWTANETKTFTLSTIPSAYKYFRMVWYKHNGDAWVGLNELSFIAKVSASESTGSMNASFWMKTSLASNNLVPFTIRNADTSPSNIYCYNSNIQVTSCNVWQYVHLTVPQAPSLSSWNRGNGCHTEFIIGGRQTSNSVSTLHTWVNDSNIGTSTSTNLWEGASNYLEFTGVQYEIGSSPTGFGFRPPPVELDLCKRYFRVIGSGLTGRWANANNAEFGVQFNPPLRIAPNTSASSNIYVTKTSGVNMSILGTGFMTASGLSAQWSGHTYNTSNGGFITLSNSSQSTTPTNGAWAGLADDVIAINAEL